MSVCKLCGYDENRATTRQEVSMNHYVNEKTGKVDSVINSREERITMKDGTVLVRQDLYKAPTAPATRTPVAVVTTPEVNK